MIHFFHQQKFAAHLFVCDQNFLRLSMFDSAICRSRRKKSSVSYMEEHDFSKRMNRTSEDC